MPPNSVAKSIFANAERAGDGVLRGGTEISGMRDGIAGARDGGREAQNPCSAEFAAGRKDAVGRKEVGSVGGKFESSSSVSSRARSNVLLTAISRSLDTVEALFR
jgi:hypothetical protein